MMRRLTPEKVESYLGEFECQRDKELGLFLRNKAMEFEKRDLSRTFLLLKEKRIAGYISLATTVLEIGDNWPVSNTLKKKMNASGGPIAAYLLGQMCKANDIEEKIGPYMIELAIMMFDEAREVCGGRVVCVDCRKELLKFYTENGFKVISNPTDDGLYRLAILY